MKKFLRSLTTLFALYGLYKALLFGLIYLIEQSPYNFYLNNSQVDYGIMGRPKTMVIGGSSNTRGDYDYQALNKISPDFSVRSSGLDEPYGTYFTLKKLAGLEKPDLILFDLPYSAYSADKFIPVNDVTLTCMRGPDYIAICKYSPKIFATFIFQESFFNSKLSYFFWGIGNNILRNKRNSHGEGENNRYPDPIDQPITRPGYQQCDTTKYFSNLHFIAEVKLDHSYIRKLHAFMDHSLNTRLLFYLPEINKGNNLISKHTVSMIEEEFHPLNSLEESSYPNQLMFDQWYHLNACGAGVNTRRLLEHLKAIGYFK